MKFWPALMLALALAAQPALAQSEKPPSVETYLSDPAMEAHARGLFTEFRCMVCKAQSIADSNADLAVDLRNLIREHVRAGDSDVAIKQYLVARYGDFVLMEPPVRGDTTLLWFGPVLLVLLGGTAIGTIIYRARNRLAAEPVSGDTGN